MNPTDLSAALVDRAVSGIEELAEAAAPGLRLPGSYGGHVVDDNTRADLLYVLSLLVDLGIEVAATVDLRHRAYELLSELSPSAVEGFWSYRVAEAVQRLGGLTALPPTLQEQARVAASSPRLLADVRREHSTRRPNYVAVAARCLYAEAALIGTKPPRIFQQLLHKLRVLLGATGTGWVNDGLGAWTQCDIYTPDIYLLCEPFSMELGSSWWDGFARVLTDLDDLVLPGGAVVWGRSTGVLAQAMTLQLAGVASLGRVTRRSSHWLARVPLVLDDLKNWFSRGIINAHSYCGFDTYRGPSRRLQLTFDVYGKMLLAASALRRAPKDGPPVAHDAYPPVDRLVQFSPGTAAAWVYRSKALSFVLPLMQGDGASYLASPRSPGLLEQPVAPLVVMLPAVVKDGQMLAPSGIPVVTEHQPGRLVIHHDGWSTLPRDVTGAVHLTGRRTAVYEVRGRTLSVDEDLLFQQPGHVTIAVPWRRDAPLAVGADGVRSNLMTRTSGIAEWRSPWGQLDEVQEAQFPLARSVRCRWSVTAPLRIATTEPQHQYSRALYDGMRNRAVIVSAGPPDDGLVDRLRDADVLHLAWPERWSGSDSGSTRDVIEAVRAARIPVVWTQHNLVPHRNKDAAAVEAYGMWARTAVAVIHHTSYGERVATSAYRYGASTRHLVVPHGHWGERYDDLRHVTRGEVERDEGWLPAEIRLAVVGQPRAEKQLQMVVDAVARSSRSDVQLVVRVDSGTVVPQDDRIIPQCGHLSESRYHRRMRAFDGILLPFATSGALATGTAFDCIGAGVAPVISDWEFLHEVFGNCAIHYGSTGSELTACIDELTKDSLQAAGAAAAALRPAYEWSDIASRTFQIFEQAVEEGVDGK